MQQTIEGLEALIERYEAELGPLDDAQLDRKPADGGWSAREAIAHLIVTVELYNARLDGLLAAHPAGAAASALAPGEHKPNWVAKLLLGVLRSEGPKRKKVKAPGVFQPPEDLATYDVDRLIDVHRTLIETAQRIEVAGLGRRKIATPLTRFLRLAACDAVEVQRLHGERHVRQALAAAGAAPVP